MAFMIGNLIFTDSFQFMNKSFLISLMIYQKTVVIIQKKEFGTENLDLITRKGVYPYD